MSTATAGRVLNLAIRDKPALLAAFMPFVTNGGLFIPTELPFELGDEVLVLLTLLEERERIPVASRVVWITPARAQGSRPQGIGVQFQPADKGATRRLIEAQLGGLLATNSRTHTL
jgi:type IV pilus assembly protein PilZ